MPMYFIVVISICRAVGILDGRALDLAEQLLHTGSGTCPCLVCAEHLQREHTISKLKNLYSLFHSNGSKLFGAHFQTQTWVTLLQAPPTRHRTRSHRGVWKLLFSVEAPVAMHCDCPCLSCAAKIGPQASMPCIAP